MSAVSGKTAGIVRKLEQLGVRIVHDSEALGRCATTDLQPGEAPECRVKPRSAADVISIVRAARETGVSLVPVSSGPPHAKGASACDRDVLVVDLSGMDAIPRLDRRNKVAIVEPGVTFDRLRERAKTEGMRPLMPLLPRASKSVIGSYIDREPTVIPKYQWDMTDPLLCIEVIFGTGDVFRTGSAAGPGSLEDQWEVGNAQKNPMGPAATDLLKLVQGAQGTMGIVTWASVKLELEPAVQKYFFVSGDDPAPLLSFARELCRKKLGDEMFLLDRVNMACVRSCITSSDAEVRGDDPAFTLAFAVAGYPGYLPAERVAYQEKDIVEVASSLGVELLPEACGIVAEKLRSLLAGPSPQPHWKSRLAQGVLDVFFLTTLDRVPVFVEALHGAASENGIERDRIGVYAQPVQQGRSCHLEFGIHHDPGDERSREAALRTVKAACPRMAGLGAFYSRPYEPWVSLAYEGRDDTVDALRRVKGVFDPDGIMNRGKLCFRGGE